MPTALDSLYAAHQRELIDFARRILAGSGHDPEDAVQDAFARAHVALARLERPVNLRAWLYTVVRNRCVDLLRRDRPRELPEGVAAHPTLTDPALRLERRDQVRRLVQDINALPDRQRSALILRELDGLSYAQVAQAVGTTVPATKSLLVRARRALEESRPAA